MTTTLPPTPRPSSHSSTDAVREKYAETATSALSSNDPGVRAVAEAFGYTAEELASIPAQANMGLSCGNPIALANLRPGEVLVDLGSGGGIDVFLAAQTLGPTGKAIGIDMTPELIARARAAAAKGIAGQPITNVEFHLASIDHLPLPDASVDVIVSNCVINLAPDKRAVFREMFRVLKPGGRVAVSDIALKRPLPAEIRDDVMAYVGCIAGAISFRDYELGLHDAGFTSVAVINAQADLNAYGHVEGQAACCTSPKAAAPDTAPVVAAGSAAAASRSVSLTVQPTPACCGPTAVAPTIPPEKADLHAHLAGLIRKYDINDYAASAKVFALKPHTA